MKEKRILYGMTGLWIISYILISILGYVIMFLQGKETGIYEYPGILSEYQLLTIILVAVYFIPLLCKISTVAKRSAHKKIAVISKTGVIFLSIWESLSIVITLLSWLNLL